ncbi:hypothetical protein AncyloWKF20_17725 [Ancylobacter sp. WKF20]|uniref:hypothetical protein n=1 Tax=Ancylobacter sp. WKF20 TaxID=3039801 RepID=UPI0024345204|nr:hypothetical protein [Ancylobacter sp. WKF20]WGD29588.1 hypothetical protein AncyloWKF20_17725 [Ancylobacter sp. WKF20]
MPALSNNIENRVRKLPKPSNATQGLQPLFEAVSNAMFALEDRLEKNVANGRIDIRITNLSSPDDLVIVIVDRGIGLDAKRYGAFCEIDTDFKQARGGKGVGRLFWLDAFSSIQVESTYAEADAIRRRAFDFVLNNLEQVVPRYEGVPDDGDRGTTITFKGLRTKEYGAHFPRRSDTFLRYFSAHFIADFLIGGGPRLFIDLDGDLTEYPKAVADLTVGKPLETTFQHKEFGTLAIVGFTCQAEASTGLEGRHQLHLLANGRTVETRKVDNLLGVTNLERDGQQDLVFHGCVSGEYLDLRVNEGRTAFNLPERTLKDISRACMEIVKERLLPDQVAKFAKERRDNYVAFVERYPTFGFDTDDTQLKRVPFHAMAPEEFASGLIKYQIRREEDRQNSLQELIDALDLENVPIDLEASVAKAAKEIQNSEQLALAQHVVRRKLALEMLDKLIRRIRMRSGREDDHHLERTLHAFICPMGIMGDNVSELKSRAHDLWVVDERLAFTRAFSSDKRLDAVLAEGGSSDRPDLLVWNLAYGLGVTAAENPEVVDVSEPLRSMMVVEFKKPGRTVYAKAEDNIEQQITRYLAQLKGGEIETFDRAKVRVAEDCIFHCYVVADIRGDLDQQLSSWATTANGQGRVRPLNNAYRGQIEVIQWQDLINDAWMRNRATLTAAGLSRNRPTSMNSKVQAPIEADEDED